jgi:hypothetical protein
MAQNFLTSIDLNGNQLIDGYLIRAIVENLAGTTPSSAADGQLYYDSTSDTLYVRADSAWAPIVRGITSSTTAVTTSVGTGGVISLAIADVVNNGASGLMSGVDKKKLDDATASNSNSTLVMRDASGRFQAAAPSADLDVANKAYVDGARSGLDVKQSVRLATNAALSAYTHSSGVLTASANGGLVIDGATLSDPADVGIRVLVKNETSSNEKYNGIYTVTAIGDGSNPWVLTRATDADTSAEVTAGMFVFVEQGTAWADSGWVLTTDGTITLGTTSLAFVQFSAAGQSIAGNGLTKSGNTIDVVGTADRITANADSIDIASTYAGQSSITTLGTITTGTWNGTDIAVTDGGTGASTASDARTNLASTTAGYTTSAPVLARVSAQTIGDTSSTSYTITHNFGTRDVTVQIYDTTTYDTVYADVVRTNTNTVTITFASAPSTNAYRVVISG